MELIPYIEQIIIYSIVLLLFVLFVSFFVYKKGFNKRKHVPNNIAEKRKQIRTYIEATSREISQTGVNYKRELKTSVYKTPTAIQAMQIVPGNISSGNITSKKSVDNKRYIIVNDSINNPQNSKDHSL